MKKLLSVITIVAVLMALCSCNNKTSSDKNLYDSFLSENYNDSPDSYYAYHDIDGNGTDELLISDNTTLTVYTVKNYVTEIGTHDFSTGTFQFFYSNNKDYPGIICFTAGGGMNRFSYITVKDGILNIEKIYDEDYSGILTDSENKIIPYSENDELINEIQKAYHTNLKLDFLPYNKNDIKLFSVLKSEESFSEKDGKEIFLDDFHSEFSENYTPSSYVFIDLDKDNSNELVVYADNGNSYLIFRNTDNNIYSYELPVRSFSNLKTDGTFMMSQGALLNEFASISFENSKYVIKTLAKAYYQTSDNENVFEIDGKSVSKDAIEKFTNEWNQKENVNWINFTN